MRFQKGIAGPPEQILQQTFAQVGPLSQVDVLITDKVFNESERGYLDANNVQLIQVGEGLQSSPQPGEAATG